MEPFEGSHSVFEELLGAFLPHDHYDIRLTVTYGRSCQKVVPLARGCACPIHRWYTTKRRCLIYHSRTISLHLLWRRLLLAMLLREVKTPSTFLGVPVDPLR